MTTIPLTRTPLEPSTPSPSARTGSPPQQQFNPQRLSLQIPTTLLLRPSRRPGSYWAQVGLRNVNAGTTNPPPPPPRRAQQGTPAGRQGLSGGGGGCPQVPAPVLLPATPLPPPLPPVCPKSQLGARRAGAVTPSESGVPPSCYVADHVEVSSSCTVCHYCASHPDVM